MNKKKLLCSVLFFVLGISTGFASEKVFDVPQKDIQIERFSFADALESSSDSEFLLFKSESEKKQIEQNGFFDWIMKYEKYILIGAIASTIAFTALSVTGAVCIGVSWTVLDTLQTLYYTGGVLFGFSWLFFLGAGAFWAFWGIAQYLKKNDYQATAFAAPVYNEIKPCESGYSIGLSVSFY
jgi:hypothetical protein